MVPADGLLRPEAVLKAAVAAALLALAAGCALFPLSEADCRPASWRGRGYADGLSGTFPQDLRLAPECRERYGAEVSVEEYLAGWRDGHDEWDRLMGSINMD